MELGLNAETVGIGGAGLTVALVTLRKLYIDWMKGRPEVANAAAVEEQFKAFRSQMALQQAEIKELRSEVTRMDRTIHIQQTKLTRTEMLVRQFVGLVQERGVEVPAFMQAELEALFKED